MSSTELPSSPIPGLRAIELTSGHEPELQRFFEANPPYFFAVKGQPAGPDQAHEEIRDEPPHGWSFTKRWFIGYVDSEGSLVAVADIISDLLTPGVWHLGLFIVATSRHGTGDAQVLYRGLEAWAVSRGAKWLRLGVVLGHVRAERFWEALGYVQIRTRGNVQMGVLTNTIRVMVKPLTGDALEDYLSVVQSDRPEISHAA